MNVLCRPGPSPEAMAVLDDPDGFILDPDLRHHFVEAAEIFIRERPR